MCKKKIMKFIFLTEEEAQGAEVDWENNQSKRPGILEGAVLAGFSATEAHNSPLGLLINDFQPAINTIIKKGAIVLIGDNGCLIIETQNERVNYKMEDWIEEAINLQDQWPSIAASKAYRHMKQDREKSLNETLAGYDLAVRLLNKVVNNYISQKDTLSNQDEEDIELAINLAKIVIPKENPLYKKFIKQCVFIKPELENKMQ